MPLQTLSLNEPIVDALVQLLTARLPGVIEQINDSNSDGILLDPPAQVLDFKPVAGTLKAGLPAVCVQDLPAKFEDDLQFSMNASHGLGIAAVIQDSDQRSLAWKLRRYVQAIANAIQLDRLAAGEGYLAKVGNVWGTAFTGTEPGPLLADHSPNAEGSSPSSYESWSWLMISCKHTEV